MLVDITGWYKYVCFPFNDLLLSAIFSSSLNINGLESNSTYSTSTLHKIPWLDYSGYMAFIILEYFQKLD